MMILSELVTWEQFGIILAIVAAVSGATIFIVRLRYSATISKQKCEILELQRQLLRSYNILRKNFVDISLMALNQDCAHATKILDDDTIERASNCAKYISAMDGLYAFLDERGLIKNEDDLYPIRQLDFYFLLSRVLIFKALKEKTINDTEIKDEIILWQERHRELLERNDELKEYFRNHYAQFGLFLRYQAQVMLLNDSEKHKIKNTFNDAINKYMKSIECSREYNGTPQNEKWSPAQSGIVSILEICVLKFGRDKKYLNEYRKAILEDEVENKPIYT